MAHPRFQQGSISLRASGDCTGDSQAAEVSTTLGFYIKSSDADQTAAMGKINRSVRDFAKFWK